MKELALIYGCYTDKGKRKENQDAFLASSSKGIWTFGVADGIGGYEFGNEAARMALEAIDAELKACSDYSISYMFFLLKKKYEQINKYIYSLGNRMSIQMGTTVSLLNFIDGKYILSNAGDTKVFIIRDCTIKTISKVHNVAAEEYEKGVITLEQYRNHSEKNVLTMCVGMSNFIQPYFNIGGLRQGDSFIICSDGIYNFISEKDLLNAFGYSSFTSKNEIQDLCEKLCMKALKNGSDDNATILAVRIL